MEPELKADSRKAQMESEHKADRREAQMEQIRALSESYTPEWRLNLSKPDMGTALACLFAEVLNETAATLEQVPDLLYHEFMQAAGCRIREACCAEGFMTFDLVKPDMPEILLPAGWGVVSQGKDGSIAMETEADVYVSAAAVGILAVDGSGKYVSEEDGKAVHGSPESRNIWLLVFDRPLEKGVISLLFTIEGTDHVRIPGLIWEYYGASGWSRLAVKDGTAGFRHTGIVRFSATSDFKCPETGGVHGWTVRIRGDGGLPKHLPKVYMNAAPVRALEPGEKGNVKPGARHRLKKTAGFVSVIRNPVCFFGGREEEGWEDAAVRTSAGLRHQFRAVTPGDYERLVRECCGDVEKVKCFSGYNSMGHRAWGEVTVVVLLKDFLEGQSGFYRVKEELEQFFQDKVSAAFVPGHGPSFVCPCLIRMDVNAVLCVRAFDQVMEVRETAGRTLEHFLNPVDGGYDKTGWSMGILPDHMQLKNCLQHVPGVFYVRQLTCRCLRLREGLWEETEWEQAAIFPWCLPFPGICEIDVEVE